MAIKVEETQLLILEFDYDSKANFIILPKVPGDIHDQHRSIGLSGEKFYVMALKKFFFYCNFYSAFKISYKKIK